MAKEMEHNDIMKEKTKLLIIEVGFLAAYYIPWDHEIIRQSGLEAFMMLREYARQHVLTCLIPAFFIAGAIAVFVSQIEGYIRKCKNHYSVSCRREAHKAGNGIGRNADSRSSGRGEVL